MGLNLDGIQFTPESKAGHALNDPGDDSGIPTLKWANPRHIHFPYSFDGRSRDITVFLFGKARE